ncbi:MAG: DUF4230 domain-containing protein [Cyclobacteriaceae bacterium]|nr:DUF4230 domain-containing protein [Cyclobacteriaceae bacterium HetDA_MAG_MS6]
MLKFWADISLFLQIAIVAVGVFAFSFFDPFGLLSTKKQTLEDTPVTVRSIKEIGKLITAEYYGEVLTSLQEAIIEEILENADHDSVQLRFVEERFFEALNDLHDRKSNLNIRGLNQGRKLYSFFYHEYTSVTQHPYYQTYLEFVIPRYFDGKDKSEIKFLKALYKSSNLEGELQKIKMSQADFAQIKTNEIGVRTADKKFKKSQIVVLGRGWVKAGIDFGTFNERNFKYDAERKIIQLIGMRPQILVCTINPWFIPEKQIKGFEVVLATKKARKPEYMRMVKTLSMQKLRQNALHAEILEKAKDNAEENLKSFFSLLIPDGIDDVIIYDDFFSYFDASLSSDSLSTLSMQTVDSLFFSEYHTDSAAVVASRDQLLQSNVYVHGRPYPVQRFASRYEFLQDVALTTGEISWMKSTEREINAGLTYLDTVNRYTGISKWVQLDRLDSVWFYPEQRVINSWIQDFTEKNPSAHSWWQIVSEDDEYVQYIRNQNSFIIGNIHRHMLKHKWDAFQRLTAIIGSTVEQYVIGDTTFIDKQKAIGTTNDTLNVKYIDNFPDKVFPTKNIHHWLNHEGDTILSLDDCVQLSKLMSSYYNIDAEAVQSLRHKTHLWKFSIAQDTFPVSRYSTWYGVLTGDTLKGIALDHIVSEDNTIARDDLLIKSNEFKGLGFSNQDTIWYYPSAPEVQSFKNRADSQAKWFWSGKRKKKYKRDYVNKRIASQIRELRTADFGQLLENALSNAKFLQVSDTLTVSRDQIRAGILPESLKFLQSYLPVESVP